MKQQCRALLFSSLFAAAGFASAAGAVSVSFKDASKYWDAGNTHWDEAANLVSLAEHLQALGKRHLRDGEVLKIEVFDVDLAGTMRPWRRSAAEQRIASGGADWPRIGLRYTLEVNGTAVRSAEESLIDMNYTRGLVGARYSEPLYHEQKMLEKWFKASFVEAAPPPIESGHPASLSHRWAMCGSHHELFLHTCAEMCPCGLSSSAMGGPAATRLYIAPTPVAVWKARETNRSEATAWPGASNKAPASTGIQAQISHGRPQQPHLALWPAAHDPPAKPRGLA